MIDPGGFYEALQRRGFSFFAGVPDSLLADFCAYISDHAAEDHVIAANEGGAVALAAGHYLATGRPAVVYMQNSGQGNAVNPLLSLADREVCAIPMLLLVGWRGEPGTVDEPQHVKQGRVTLDLFEAMEIPYEVLPDADDAAEAALDRVAATMRSIEAPGALVARKGTFAPYRRRPQIETSCPYALTRETAIGMILDASDDHQTVVVGTTGHTSRELFEWRQAAGRSHRTDFRTVGCMGHASQIALGIALARPDRRVVCLDGDGAVIMHLGALALIGSRTPANFLHVVLNNGAHDSVGGQPTVGFAVDIPAIALACGYRAARRATTAAEVVDALAALRRVDGATLLEVRVRTGARANLGRPTVTPASNKRELMGALGV